MESLLRRPKDQKGAPDVVLSGADPFAPHVLEDYAARCAETGRPDDAEQARRDAASLRAWQHANAKRGQG